MVTAGSDHLTSEDLTARLLDGGTLPTGRVVAVQPGQTHQTLISSVRSYRVEYSPDAPPEAPTRLILKGSGSGIDPLLRRTGEQEAAFYRQAAPLTPTGLLPRCYDAQVTETGVRLLLEDLSDTHLVVTVWPVPPTIEVCERIVDTWAAFHAFCRLHPHLGRVVRTLPDVAPVACVAGERRRRYAGFAEHLGARLASGPRALYNSVLDTLDHRITPALLRQHCTIVHGDAHVWNVLYPRRVDAG